MSPDGIGCFFQYTDNIIFIVDRGLSINEFLGYLNENSCNSRFTGTEQIRSIEYRYLHIYLMGSVSDRRIQTQ